MAIDAQLLLQIDASTEILRREIAKATTSVDDFAGKTTRSLGDIDKAVYKAGQTIGTHIRQVVGLGLAYAGLSSIKAAIGDSFEYASALGETAQQLGVTTKFLQEYRFAATQQGASTEAADKAIGKFSITLGKAREGSAQAQAAFKTVGISLDDLAHLSTDELFAKVADGVAKIPDPARQAAAAVALFGKGGQALIPVLQGGSQGLNEFAAAAQKAGMVLSDETINKLDQLADKGAAIRQVISVQLAAAIGANADAILRLGNAAAGAIGAVGRLVSQAEGLRRISQYQGVVSTLMASGDTAERASDPLIYKGMLEAKVRGAQQDVRAASGSILAAPLERAQAKLAETRKALADFVGSPEYREAKKVGLLSTSKPTAAVGNNFDVTSPPPKGGAGGGTSARERAARQAAADAKEKQDLADSRAALFAGSNVFGFGKELAEIDAIRAKGVDLKETLQAAFKLQDVDTLPNVTAQLRQMADQSERAADAGARFVDGLSSGLADAIVGGKNLGNVLVDSLKRAAAEAITNGLFKAIGGIGGSGGGLFKSIGRILGFADGGDPPVGVPSIVGERGPELFVPKVPGTIRPSGSFGMGGGQTTVAVDVTASPLLIAGVRMATLQAGQQGGNAAFARAMRPRAASALGMGR